MNAKMRRMLSDESGVALITVIGVMVVITILAIGSFVLAQQTLQESKKIEGQTQAFRSASGGLDTVLTTFSDESTATDFPVSGSTQDGSYTVTLEDLGGSEYRLTSTGTGKDGSQERVKQQFYYMNLWKMNFAGTGPQSLISGSGGLAGTSNIIGPFYMKGNLPIANNMSCLEGPFFVKGGNITVGSSGSLGTSDKYVKVYCDGTGSPSVPANGAQGGAGGVFVTSVSRSVPDITLPTINDEMMLQYASKAQAESVDNLRGTPDKNLGANLETSNGQATDYRIMKPPSTTTYTRAMAQATPTNSNYKFIGRSDGVISAKGAGTTALTIGGRTFGAWGSLTTTNGAPVVLTAGPTGVNYTLANTYDDFAYDNVKKILYISGTVFVDGPLTIGENMTYVGNGSIVANGPIYINGTLKPYGTNTQGELNKWALGLVTPVDMYVNFSSNNNYANKTADEIRAVSPDLAGAFFCQGTVHFGNNPLVRGSVIAGKLDSGGPNMCLVTNPLLPTYLPDSLPGVDRGLLMPGLWTRG